MNETKTYPHRKNSANVPADDVMTFILDYKATNDGIPPTMREIMSAANLSSTSVVKYYIDNLVKRGMIRVVPNVSRGIRVMWDAQSFNA